MTTATDMAAGTAVELFLAALALGLLYRVYGSILAVPRRQTILPFQRGILMEGGSILKELGPGRHWVLPKRTLLLCEMRPKPFEINGQELLAADLTGLRVSMAGEFRISDPSAFVTASADAFGAFYLEIRQALRTAVTELDSESILNERTLLVARMRDLLIPRGAQLGIDLTQLDAWEIVPTFRARPI